MKFTAGVLTTSDRASAGIYEDKSGKVLIKLLEEMDFEVKFYEVIADDFDLIKEKLLEYSDQNINLILTTGGTGLAKRDVTVDATLAVIEKQVPGFSEAMRVEAVSYTHLRAHET